MEKEEIKSSYKEAPSVFTDQVVKKEGYRHIDMKMDFPYIEGLGKLLKESQKASEDFQEALSKIFAEKLKLTLRPCVEDIESNFGNQKYVLNTQHYQTVYCLLKTFRKLGFTTTNIVAIFCNIDQAKSMKVQLEKQLTSDTCDVTSDGSVNTSSDSISYTIHEKMLS